jgi:PST family polysaccharide transporter
MTKPTFEMTAGVRAALNNIGWLSVDRVIRMGGSLLVGTIVARYLGPSQFGVFNLAVAIYMLFNTVSGLGLDYLVVRDITLQSEGDQEILGTAFLLKAAASVLTTIAAVLFSWLSHPNTSLIVLMVALLSVASVSQAFDVVEYFFQAKTLSRHSVLPKTIVFVFASGARLAAVALHAKLLVFAIILSLEIFMGEIALLLRYVIYNGGLPSWKFRQNRGRALLRESWPLVIAGLLVMIYMRTDQIILGYLTNNRTVGYYSAAVRISEIWYAIPSLICASVMPRLLLYIQTDKAIYYKRIQFLYNYMVLLSVGLALITVPASRVVVSLIFGKDYLPAASILSVHIWTGVFVYIGVVGGQQLIHEQLTKIELRRAFLGAAVNLILNFLLIPRYGGIGSAWATLIAQATASYVSDAFNSRTHHLFLMKTRALSGLWLIRREFR